MALVWQMSEKTAANQLATIESLGMLKLATIVEPQQARREQSDVNASFPPALPNCFFTTEMPWSTKECLRDLC